MYAKRHLQKRPTDSVSYLRYVTNDTIVRELAKNLDARIRAPVRSMRQLIPIRSANASSQHLKRLYVQKDGYSNSSSPMGYACVYVCVHICVNVCVVCVSLYMCLCMCKNTIYINIYIYIYVYIYIYIYTFIYLFIMYIYIHIYICILSPLHLSYLLCACTYMYICLGCTD